MSSRNLALDAALNVLNGGEVLVLDGTQATDGDTAITTQVTLATVPMNATAFSAAASASKTANAFTTATAVATSTTTWYRMRTSAHVGVWDGSAGTSAANMIWNSVAVQSGAAVSITSFVASMAA